MPLRLEAGNCSVRGALPPACGVRGCARGLEQTWRAENRCGDILGGFSRGDVDAGFARIATRSRLARDGKCGGGLLELAHGEASADGCDHQQQGADSPEGVEQAVIDFDPAEQGGGADETKAAMRKMPAAANNPADRQSRR